MAKNAAASMTFGLIVGNRGFFPDYLVKDGREFMLKRLKQLGYKVVCLTPADSKHGSVESWQDAKACAELFKKHREAIDGIIVTLPNFGDERAVADTLKLAGLDVPVLIHAWGDDPKNMTIKHRRDSFCGKMSVCNNLKQYGIKFSLTALHTMDPASDLFVQEVHDFAATCRVVKGLRNCRVGALGARPAAFNTVRYSEKLLQGSGISVETMDLLEIIGRADRLKDNDARVKAKIEGIQGYVPTKGVPMPSLIKMARFSLVIEDWMAASDLDVTAIQCWTALEEYFGVVPCTCMSMMSNGLRSSACEVDVAGAVGMHALALASQRPSFLLDWNNNYGEDPNKCVTFHCSNLPKDCFETATMDFQEIIANAVGKASSYGTVVGRIKPGPMTYCRVSTFDSEGYIGAYLGEGRFTDDKLQTFGGFGVTEVPDLQTLLHYACENGFEHHVAANHSESARAVYEALDKYMGWDVYWHEG